MNAKTSNVKQELMAVVTAEVPITRQEQPLGCHNETSILFEEALAITGGKRKFVYQHSTSCLTSDCNGRLSLLSGIDVRRERKCFFRRLNWC
ncbi:hypothetical protein ACROYT_G026003 [Oculina patagonica]